MILARVSLCLAVSAGMSACVAAAATNDTARPDTDGVKRFVATMHERHGFDASALQSLFRQVRLQPAILEAIARPAEAKPWYQYRPLFVTPERVAAGVVFWRDHAAELARAEAEFGVNAEIIVAIIGVETFYGRNTGRYRVMDALSTLAFNYPKRSGFFRNELENFLLLARDQHVDPLSLSGSYAGAMGLPQFMPSSYRHYAVDFDLDGHTDIWNDPADAIGSVARYLSAHGWRRGDLIALPVRVRGDAYKKLVAAGTKPSIAFGTLSHYGVVTDARLASDEKVALLEYETANGHDYWLGLQNFYAITRYNTSTLYAMAVYQLSLAMREGYDRHGN